MESLRDVLAVVGLCLLSRRQAMSQRTRPMSVADKRIIGVQVLPDPSAALGGHCHALSSTPLSAASAHERNNNLAGGGGAAVMTNDEKSSPMSHDSSSSSGLKWKLRHHDFMPNTIKSKKEDDFERFSLAGDYYNNYYYYYYYYYYQFRATQPKPIIFYFAQHVKLQQER